MSLPPQLVSSTIYIEHCSLYLVRSYTTCGGCVHPNWCGRGAPPLKLFPSCSRSSTTMWHSTTTLSWLFFSSTWCAECWMFQHRTHCPRCCGTRADPTWWTKWSCNEIPLISLQILQSYWASQAACTLWWCYRSLPQPSVVHRREEHCLYHQSDCWTGGKGHCHSAQWVLCCFNKLHFLTTDRILATVLPRTRHSGLFFHFLITHTHIWQLWEVLGTWWSNLKAKAREYVIRHYPLGSHRSGEEIWQLCKCSSVVQCLLETVSMQSSVFLCFTSHALTKIYFTGNNEEYCISSSGWSNCGIFLHQILCALHSFSGNVFPGGPKDCCLPRCNSSKFQFIYLTNAYAILAVMSCYWWVYDHGSSTGPPFQIQHLLTSLHAAHEHASQNWCQSQACHNDSCGLVGQLLGGEYLCFPTALPHLLCSALLDDGNMIIGDKDDFGVVLD